MKSSFNPWPYGIVVFFILLVGGLAAVVVISVTHRDSMVSENYYEQELKYQSQMESAARAQKSGAQIELEAGAGGKAPRLTLRLPAEQVQAASRCSGELEFYRPASAALDRKIALAPGPDGVQTVDLSGFASGRWTVRAQWTAGGQGYFLEQKLAL